MAKKVAIFCSASQKIDPKYNDAAREVVRALHSLGYDVVSGGGAIGTMGAITDESLRVGGHHTAVLPEFMKGLENPGLADVVWTPTMAARKAKMREGTVAVIALPGGIGTLDEIIETHTLRKLHKYDGALYALNLDGFYDPLIALLNHYQDTRMLEPEDNALLRFPASVAELIACFK